MGLKSIFGGKKLIDRLTKYFNENNIALERNGNKHSFELILKECSYALYPYFLLDDDNDELSIVINIRKIDGIASINDYEKINSFNQVSKYFTAKISKDNVIFIEYNAIVCADNIKEIFINSLESITSLQKEIDAL
ncbi:MAG: hypothetical protein IJA65_04450 [Acholeplasmatales bacterium]|nr:hypothetical protein [Acholeplasmatales bacterium]